MSLLLLVLLKIIMFLYYFFLSPDPMVCVYRSRSNISGHRDHSRTSVHSCQQHCDVTLASHTVLHLLCPPTAQLGSLLYSSYRHWLVCQTMCYLYHVVRHQGLACRCLGGGGPVMSIWGTGGDERSGHLHGGPIVRIESCLKSQ